jgi:hypothetical protein
VGPFFSSSNVPFDLRYVLIIRDGVEGNRKISELCPKRLKLSIHEHVVKLETTLHVDAFDLFNVGQDGRTFLIL